MDITPQDLETIQELQTLGKAVTDIIENPDITVADIKPKEEPKLVPAQIQELVLWNKTQTNIHVGVAIIRGDQLHCDFFQSSQLSKQDRDLPTMSEIKFNCGKVFKLGTPVKDTKDANAETVIPEPELTKRG
jgi:hypothetical protein